MQYVMVVTIQEENMPLLFWDDSIENVSSKLNTILRDYGIYTQPLSEVIAS